MHYGRWKVAELHSACTHHSPMERNFSPVYHNHVRFQTHPDRMYSLINNVKQIIEFQSIVKTFLGFKTNCAPHLQAVSVVCRTVYFLELPGCRWLPDGRICSAGVWGTAGSPLSRLVPVGWCRPEARGSPFPSLHLGAAPSLWKCWEGPSAQCLELAVKKKKKEYYLDLDKKHGQFAPRPHLKQISRVQNTEKNPEIQSDSPNLDMHRLSICIFFFSFFLKSKVIYLSTSLNQICEKLKMNTSVVAPNW